MNKRKLHIITFLTLLIAGCNPQSEAESLLDQASRLMDAYPDSVMHLIDSSTKYWLRQSLKLSCFENGFAGYKSNYDNNWVSDYILLTGISGIGLSYLSYLEGKPICWNELFLL